MKKSDPKLSIRFARNGDEIRSAQNLRYRVFVEELGGRTPLTDHANRLERDEYDPLVQHLCLFDTEREKTSPETAVVGVYRLIDDNLSRELGGFYSENEFEISKILSLRGKRLELGRSCIDPAYRGGAAMAMLWSALGQYVETNQIDYLFGAASFLGTELEPKKEALSNLFHNYLINDELAVSVREEKGVMMNWFSPDEIKKLRAMRDTPSLIKAYLRLGGAIGNGAFVDYDFNTIDVFVFMKTKEMVQKYQAMYR